MLIVYGVLPSRVQLVVHPYISPHKHRMNHDSGCQISQELLSSVKLTDSLTTWKLEHPPLFFFLQVSRGMQSYLFLESKRASFPESAQPKWPGEGGAYGQIANRHEAVWPKLQEEPDINRSASAVSPGDTAGSGPLCLSPETLEEEGGAKNESTMEYGVGYTNYYSEQRVGWHHRGCMHES